MPAHVTELDLLDYRRAVAEAYARLRDPSVPAHVRCRRFREEKDRLFRKHPASPLEPEQRAGFRGLTYHPFDASWRRIARLDTDVRPEVFEIALRNDGPLRIQRVGHLRFEAFGAPQRLSLFWVMGYGGGAFVPFRDATSGDSSYGGGRYLVDTIKHADLGSEDGGLVLDFNHAYNPSCAYSPRWECPLAPPENTLEVPVRAGERIPALP